MEREERTQSQDLAATNTSNEHDAIIAAIRVLESALASPTTGRENAWLSRVDVDLSPVVQAVSAHCEAAESPGGLVAELEASLGRPRVLVTVSDEHKALNAQVKDLLDSLSGKADVEAIRARAAALTADLRKHQAHEADLIYEAFFRDIGVGN